MINECKLLKTVKFIIFNLDEEYLEILRQNSYVKQWNISYSTKTDGTDCIDKLDQIIKEKQDNSIFINAHSP